MKGEEFFGGDKGLAFDVLAQNESLQKVKGVLSQGEIEYILHLWNGESITKKSISQGIKYYDSAVTLRENLHEIAAPHLSALNHFAREYWKFNSDSTSESVWPWVELLLDGRYQFDEDEE